jgi:hypothetical protein
MDLFRGTVGGGRFRSPSDSRERRCGGGQARQAGSLEKAAPRQCDHGLAIVFGFLGSDPGISLSLSINVGLGISINISISISIRGRCIVGPDSSGLESGGLSLSIGIGIRLRLSINNSNNININININICFNTNINVSFNIRGRCIVGPDSGGLARCGLARCGLARCGFERGGLARCGFERCGFERCGLERCGLGRRESSAAVGVRGTLGSIVHQTVCSSIADQLAGFCDFRQPAAGPLTRLSQA